MDSAWSAPDLQSICVAGTGAIIYISSEIKTVSAQETKMKSNMPITTQREPLGGSASSRPQTIPGGRGFVVPDAAAPGPIDRCYPLESVDDDSAAGGDSFEDRDSQNQDRI
jgi:hypothetical protein